MHIAWFYPPSPGFQISESQYALLSSCTQLIDVCFSTAAQTRRGPEANSDRSSKTYASKVQCAPVIGADRTDEVHQAQGHHAQATPDQKRGTPIISKETSILCAL